MADAATLAPTPPEVLWAQRVDVLRGWPAPFLAAFAARCARRVERLRDRPGDFPLRWNYLGLLAGALNILERYATGKARASEVGDLSAAVDAVLAVVAAASPADVDALRSALTADLAGMQSSLAGQPSGAIETTLDATEEGPLGPLWPAGAPAWYSAEPAPEPSEGPFFHPDATELGKQAVLAFRRDLPELLKKYPGRWVAYHGDRQVGIARTDLELYKEVERLGIPSDDYLVWAIEPEPPDVVFLD